MISIDIYRYQGFGITMHTCGAGGARRAAVLKKCALLWV